MKRHLYINHGVGEAPSEVKDKMCPHCGKVVPAPRLSTHIDQNHKSYVWKCKICSKEFNNPITAKNHPKFHSITKPWKCFHCDYCSYSQPNVAIHLRNVHKETTDLFKRQIKVCKYLYEVEIKGSLVEKIYKPGGATYTGNKRKKNKKFCDN